MTHPVALNGAVVLVTGANGGLGAEFVQQALDLGAAKVYATARTPRAWPASRVVPLALDVTDPESVALAAATATDVTVVIINAGASNNSLLSDPDQRAARELFDVNFFGAIDVVNAFAPVLKANGGGALLNVLSVLSWLGIASTYSATKAALWSATNTQRLELAQQGTLVTGLYLGYTDTPMTKDVDAPKNRPEDVVAQAYAGLAEGAYEVLADDVSRQVKAGLAAPIEALYPQLA